MFLKIKIVYNQFFCISVEIEQLLESQEIDFVSLLPENLDYLWNENDESKSTMNIFGNSGSGSGGYSDYIFLKAAEELFKQKINKLNYKTLK